jgi:uncharacterized protein
VVEVRFRRDARNRYSSILASGHAGWADSGADIVCAAVAALLQAVWLGLSEYAHVPLEAQRDKGELSLRWPEEVRERADVAAIVGTAELAVTQIARQYADHVRAVSEAETEDGAA